MLDDGDTFDRYTIEAILGEGGMGRVYRAYDPKLHRHIALKVLSVPPSKDRDRRQHRRSGSEANPSEGAVRMQREARAAAALDHPNAVSIFDVGDVDGVPFIAMELVDGKSLRTFVGAAGIAWNRRLRWLADVATALAAAHRRGLVHRDIKPENVMVRKDDVVKVLDFGIARRPDVPVDPTGETQAGGISAITGKGVIVGTPHYMSPEQMRGDSLDGRSDQFAWGVLAYELLSGRTPWKRSDDSLANVAELLTRDPAPLDLEGLPPVVEHAIKRTLSLSRDDRYANMEELVRVLDPYVAGSSARHLIAANADDEDEPPPTKRATATSSTTETETQTQTQTETKTETTLSQPTPAPDGAEARPGTPSLVRATTPTQMAGGHRRWLPAALGALAIASALALAFRQKPTPTSPPSPPSPPPSAALVPKPQPTAVTDLPEPRSSTKPEALAAYRLAMQAYRDGLGAVDARFRHVIELDPNFAEAHLRLAFATFQTSPTEARVSYARATELRASLSDRDQALLRALEPYFVWQPPSITERTRRLREAVAKYPLDADLMFMLGVAAGDDWLSNEHMAPLERAVELDPKFARAWWQLGQQHAYSGDVPRAREDLGKCLDVSSAATSCLWNRIGIDEIEGRCDAVEADARRWIAVDPTDPLGHFALAAALYARARPAASVDEALRKQEAAVPTLERDREVEQNAIRRAMLRGDFASVEKHARTLETMLETAGASGESEHQAPARAIVQALLESGRTAEAGRYAERYLQRREAWAPDSFNEDFAVANDVVLLMQSALRASGSIQGSVFAARRDAWVTDWKKRMPPLAGGYVWIHGWAASSETKADATLALAALADQTLKLPAFTPKTLATAFVGHTYLLAGRIDEALPLLERAASSCIGLELPWVHTRAQLWLARAHEAHGDSANACLAYGVVLERWGHARPRSISADEARARMKSLQCASE